MGLALKDTEQHCYSEYLHWPDNNYELIDGEAYFMTPAPNLEHQEVAGEIFRQIENALVGKKCRVLIAPIDVRLPKKDEVDKYIDTVVQPDVLVVCDRHKLDRRGVREYWIIHPIDRVLTIYRLQNGEYGKAELLELSGSTAISILDDVQIEWDDLLTRLPTADEWL